MWLECGKEAIYVHRIKKIVFGSLQANKLHGLRDPGPKRVGSANPCFTT